MRARKGWANLSTAQRRRYDRAGITERAYASGASLTAARGHATTPERPARAERHPERYSSYLSRFKPMRVVSTLGVVIVAGMTRADRSLVGKHANAVRRHIEGMTRPAILSRYHGVPGTQELSDFAGRTVTGYLDGSDRPETVELESLSSAIDAQYFAGQLSYESIYQKAS